MGTIHKIALALTIIGALNWGLVGVFRFDVVAELAGGYREPVARLIYILIGVSGLLNLGLLFDDFRNRETIEIHTPKEI
ncbi:DUF378 domain-containing protein [Sporosarcina sp. FA9]|uniref:DUF378 domain-containing protein n=1 Tax=Sporosarcina sp. FA9 TaxID=3413030 RepID=UPI003F65831A